MVQGSAQLVGRKLLIQGLSAKHVWVERCQLAALVLALGQQTMPDQATQELIHPLEDTVMTSTHLPILAALCSVGRQRLRVAPVREDADAIANEPARSAIGIQPNHTPANGVGADIQSEAIFFPGHFISLLTSPVRLALLASA